LAVALVGVLAFIALRPSGGSDPEASPEKPTDPPASDVSPDATSVPTPSEEAFCLAYGELAAAQGQYVALPDEGGARLLLSKADALVATGVPDSMSMLARTGYFVEISGIYTSLGQALDRSAVPGALEDDGSGTSVTGSGGAFGSWLNDFCPGW